MRKIGRNFIFCVVRFSVFDYNNIVMGTDTVRGFRCCKNEKNEEDTDMKPYREMSKEELASLKEQLEAVYKKYQGKKFKA